MQDSPAYDETVIDQKGYSYSIWVCYYDDGFTTQNLKEFEAHLVINHHTSGYGSGDMKTITVPDQTHTVHHDATGHYETVVVQNAYDEVVTDTPAYDETVKVRDAYTESGCK